MNKISFQPAIKWSGSKRSQAWNIIKLFPKFDRYYEPFVGGASITYALNPNRGICGDICKPLIEIWKIIKSDPLSILNEYKKRWILLQEQGHTVYYEIRDNFNKTQNPYDLFFLTRTCVNGLIRFNKDGLFNNSFHHTRKGIHPDKLHKIILNWSYRLKNIEFRHGDYRVTTEDITKNDFIYLDPPYFNTRGRYYGTIDFNEFLEFLYSLNSRGIKFALSFDGKREDVNYMVELPKDLYKRHILIESGNSSFKKVMDKDPQKVFESLYLNW